MAIKHILLDTNAYTAFKRGISAAREILEHVPFIGLSPIMLGELYGGFALGTQEQRNLEELERFLASRRVHVLETTAETAGSAAAEPSASGQTGNSGKIALVAVLALALVGGAIFYVLKNKKSKPKTKGPTDLDDYDYGDDTGDEEEYENEDEPETPAPQSDTGPEDAEK